MSKTKDKVKNDPNFQEALEQAKLVAEELKYRQAKLHETLKDLNEAEREAVLKESFADYGVDIQDVKKAMAALPKFAPVSTIMEELGWYPVKQVLDRISLQFGLQDLIRFEIVENGIEVHFLRDFGKTDRLKGWSQAEYTWDPIMNPPTGKVKQQAFGVNIPLHIGFSMFDTALNQVVRDLELFKELFNMIEFNVLTPWAIEFYTFRLGLIAADIEFDMLAAQPVNFDTLDLDFEIEAEDYDDAIIKIKNFQDSLKAPSRANIPDRFKVFDENLMSQYQPNEFKWIWPIGLDNELGVKVKMGAFNESYAALASSIISLDYDKTFGEFGIGTNYKNGQEGVYDLRLWNPDFAKVIAQFETMDISKNRNLFTVAHMWGFYGASFNYAKPSLRGRLTIKPKEENGGGEEPFN